MDSEFFTARVYDAVSYSERNKTPKFLGFLTPQEAAIADSVLKKQHAKYMLYGGYDGAERQFLACPIGAIIRIFRLLRSPSVTE